VTTAFFRQSSASNAPYLVVRNCHQLNEKRTGLSLFFVVILRVCRGWNVSGSEIDDKKMTNVRSIVKALVPAPARRFAKSKYHEYIFNRAMKRFLKDTTVLTRPGNTVVTDLIYGWGNESWSALEEYLIACTEHALVADGPVLECGSGLSTILVGAIAKSRGLRHLALEHEPEWARRVQGYLDKYRIDSAKLCVKPLKDYGEFSWYDPPTEAMSDSFAMVICDGPPGTTKGGRYGLGAIMTQCLQPGCIILLDDAGREQERLIARRWEAELDVASEMCGTAKPYIKMTIKDRQPAKRHEYVETNGIPRD
jgi:hypothetical protein